MVDQQIFQPANAIGPIPQTRIRRIEADGVSVFHREAGPQDAGIFLAASAGIQFILQ